MKADRCHPAPWLSLLRLLPSLAAAGIVWLLTTRHISVPASMALPGFDKLAHAGVFCLLTIVFSWSFKPWTRWITALFIGGYLAVVFGALVELVQAGSATRSCEWADLLADSSGALSAILIVRLLTRIGRKTQRPATRDNGCTTRQSG